MAAQDDQQADALEAMASRDADAHASALEAMASGMHEQVEADRSADGAPDDAPASPETPGPIEGFEFVQASSTPEQRKARQQRIQAAAQKHHGEQFKKTMVPPLLVCGVLLVVLGAVALATVRGDADVPMVGAGGARIVIYGSFPLGALLIFGAWWMHRQVAAADKDRRENSAD
jgi:hypothetical protein